MWKMVGTGNRRMNCIWMVRARVGYESNLMKRMGRTVWMKQSISNGENKWGPWRQGKELRGQWARRGCALWVGRPRRRERGWCRWSSAGLVVQWALRRGTFSCWKMRSEMGLFVDGPFFLNGLSPGEHSIGNMAKGFYWRNLTLYTHIRLLKSYTLQALLPCVHLYYHFDHLLFQCQTSYFY